MTRRDLDVGSVFASRAVGRAAGRIIRLVNATTHREALRHIGALVVELKDQADRDAAFLACQILRDLDILDPEEAAYLFVQLWRSSADIRVVDDEALEYFRSHGEEGLAALIVDDPEVFRAVLDSAADSLLDKKPLRHSRPKQADDPVRIASMTERLLALSASAEGPEREATWASLKDAMKGLSPEAQLRAASRLKEIGALSPAEHAAVVEHVSVSLMASLTMYDREMRRRSRSNGLGGGEVPSPFPRRERDDRYSLPPRSWRIQVAILRQLGEHELANLYLSNGGAYRELIRQGTASMPIEQPRAPGDARPVEEPSEEDLDLAADYWGGLLADAESQAFEERFRDDDAFFDRISPVMTSFDSGHPAPSLTKRVALRRAERRMEGLPRPRRTPPDEAEVALVDDYIDDRLSADEERVFEARLLVDGEFFVRVAPYVRRWLMGDGQSLPAKQLRRARPDLYQRVMRCPISAKTELADEAEANLLADYVSRSMSDEEIDRFHERLATDQGFFERVSPVLVGWFLRLSPEFIEMGIEATEEAARREARKASKKRGAERDKKRR
jgi:hypothetical protein